MPVCEADVAFSNLRRTDDGRYLDESTGHRLGDSNDLDDAARMERGIRLSLAKSPAEAVRAQRAVFLSRFATPAPAAASTSQPASEPSPGANCVGPIKSDVTPVEK